MSTPRNAPCPCGSGKKYKLCCLSADGGTPPTSAAEVAARAVRAKAFDKLAAFGARREFDYDSERAFDAFWSPVFLSRAEGELEAAYSRDEAEGGEVMYFTLDAATGLGKTVAEHFLSEPRKGLLAQEQDYLRRLSATRMGIFRVEEVRRNRGLTCTDLWSGERIDIREVLLTHDVVPGKVIGARPLLAADGVWELVGALYPFTPEQGDAVVAILRAQYSAAREADPTLTEERFLKHYAAAIINRFWFAHVFFPVDEDDYDYDHDHDHDHDYDYDYDDDDDDDDDYDADDDDDYDADADADDDDDDEDDYAEDFASAEDEELLGLEDDDDLPFPLGRNADDAFTRRVRRPADLHTDVASADPQILELRDFLDSDVAADAMPIDWLHGFLCAIACGPTNMSPLVWLTHVWGDTLPGFESPAQADHITNSIINLASSIEQAVSAKTLVPLLPRSVTGDMTNIAQGWCAGFEEGIRLDGGGWAPLLQDEDQCVLLAPLWIIGMSTDGIEDAENHAQAVTQAIDILPDMVSVIDDYWNPTQRSPLRTKRVLARRRHSNAGTTVDNTDVAMVAHDPARQGE